MKRTSLLIIAIFWFAPVSQGQQIKFLPKDDLIKVVAGQVVEIKADTAYVVSLTRAQFINDKLNELDEVRALYANEAEQRIELLTYLSDLENQMDKLLVRMKDDEEHVDIKLSSVLGDMDVVLKELKLNNESLKKNNGELDKKINSLEHIVKKLRKERKGLWWNGLTDKLVALTGGIGIGLLISAVL